MTPKLKPCPFCGECSAKFLGDAGGKFVMCNACWSATSFSETSDGAARLWNRRAKSQVETKLRPQNRGEKRSATKQRTGGGE